MSQQDTAGGERRFTAAELDRLATFPEQNPNLVIETDLRGRVNYLNPIAAEHFPELRGEGQAHPLLDDVGSLVTEFRSRGEDFVSRQVHVGDAIFEQKICFTPAGDQAFIRIYAHDITALKQAEQATQVLARRLVHTQEVERHRVSRELHDEAGQALAALKISLQLLLPDSPEEMHPTLVQAIELVESTRQGIRQIAYGLRPPALDALGLNTSLEHLCTDTTERTHLEVTYQGRDLPPLSDGAEMCLYRFVQEALTNTAVHAEATRAYVRLTTDPDAVRVRVADDGKGMDVAVLDDPVRAGLGIVGMKERLQLLSGRLEASSLPGRGTEMIAVLPIGDSP